MQKGRVMNIGEVIKCRRQKRNLTQAELAVQLNITPQAVSRWEMNISYPDIAMLPQIAEALQISTDELLGVRLSGTCRDCGEPTDRILNQSQADSIFDYVPASVSGKGKKVLVTDDADFLRGLLEDILTKKGHTVLLARNGRECLDILQNENVDVCVLDIVMPVMDGMETLKKIREKGYPVKVIMLSALAQASCVRQALELGADSFVVKPFHEDCLFERIG